MRLLLLPIYYQSRDLHAVSNVNAMLDLARAVTLARPDAFVHVALPERKPNGWRYRDELYVGERIAPLFFEPLLGQERAQVGAQYEDLHVDFALWNALNDQTKTDLYFDAVVNAKVEVASHLKSMMGCYTRVFRDVPIINFVNDVYWLEKQREAVQRRWVLNMLTDWPQFLSAGEVAVARRLVRRYASAAETLRVLERPFMVPMPMNFQRCDALRQLLGPRPEHPKPVVFYGGAVVTKKRVPDSVELVRPLWITGKVGGYVVTTPTDDPELLAPLRAETGYVTLHEGPSPRDTFLARTYEGDIFHCLSTDESAGIAYFEMLAMGLVGIFLKAPWMEGRLPADYPFMARTMADVQQMTFWVAANLEEARRLLAPSVAWLRQTLDVHNCVTTWLGHVDRIVAAHRAENKLSGDKVKFFRELVRVGVDGAGRPEQLSLAEVNRAVEVHSEAHLKLPQLRYRFGKQAVLDAMGALGYADTCQQAIPVFRRVQDTGAA